MSLSLPRQSLWAPWHRVCSAVESTHPASLPRLKRGTRNPRPRRLSCLRAEEPSCPRSWAQGRARLPGCFHRRLWTFDSVNDEGLVPKEGQFGEADGGACSLEQNVLSATEGRVSAGVAGTAKGSTRVGPLHQPSKGSQEPTGEREEKAGGTVVQGCGMCKDGARSSLSGDRRLDTPDSDPMAGPGPRPRGAMSLSHGLIPLSRVALWADENPQFLSPCATDLVN